MKNFDLGRRLVVWQWTCLLVLVGGTVAGAGCSPESAADPPSTRAVTASPPTAGTQLLERPQRLPAVSLNDEPTEPPASADRLPATASESDASDDRPVRLSQLPNRPSAWLSRLLAPPPISSVAAAPEPASTPFFPVSARHGEFAPAAPGGEFRRLPDTQPRFEPEPPQRADDLLRLPPVSNDRLPKRTDGIESADLGFPSLIATRNRFETADGEGSQGARARAADDKAGERGDRASNGATARREPIGERPPESTNDLLVLNTGILLRPKTWQTEIGAIYARQQLPGVAVLSNQTIALERIRSRRFFAPFSVRYGWTKENELFATVPLGWAQYERDDPLSEVHDTSGVLGDISFGLIHQFDLHADTWCKKPAQVPDVTFTFTVRAPTGTSSLRSLTGDVAATGNGFWDFSGRLNFTKSYDPVVVFGGVGYDYQLAEDFNGVTVQPGDSFSYYFGVGFGVSDDVSLSATVSGAWTDRTSLNGIVIPNSDIEPASLRLSYLRRITLKDRIQPFVDFGLTPDSSGVALGFVLVHDQ